MPAVKTAAVARRKGLAGRLLRGRSAVIGRPCGWLLVFFMAPCLIVLNCSVSEMGAVRPENIVTLGDGVMKLSIKFGNYGAIFGDALYLKAYLSSLKYAAITTLVCLLLGYPFAYFMARAKPALQAALLMGVMLPF